MTTLAQGVPARRELVPSPILGMAIFLFTEVMVFCGLISAYVILRGQAEFWPPIGQPRLPAGQTAINSLPLLVSGFTMCYAVSALRERRTGLAVRLLRWTVLFGGMFVLMQGMEWVQLVRYGLTTSSSLYGSLFYTIVGCHAVHVVAAVIALLVVWRRAVRGHYTAERNAGLRAMRLYWMFVVGVWPPLYVLVYLW